MLTECDFGLIAFAHNHWSRTCAIYVWIGAKRRWLLTFGLVFSAVSEFVLTKDFTAAFVEQPERNSARIVSFIRTSFSRCGFLSMVVRRAARALASGDQYPPPTQVNVSASPQELVLSTKHMMSSGRPSKGLNTRSLRRPRRSAPLTFSSGQRDPRSKLNPEQQQKHAHRTTRKRQRC